MEDLEDYFNTGIRLGGGGFATVYLGYSVEGACKVALKDIKLEIYQEMKKENYIEIEWGNMRTLKSCPQVLKLLNVYEIKHRNSKNIYKKIVITEFCDEDLGSFIEHIKLLHSKGSSFKKGEKLFMPEKWVLYFISEITSAFRAMHSNKIIHR